MGAPVDDVAAQPCVAAAIGPDTSGAWQRLIASFDVGMKTRLDTPHVRFAASRATGLERVRHGWCWGRHVQRDRRPTDPRDAAHELDLAGIWWNGTTGVLHTGVLGVQELYTRTIGDTMYVANRISPLASIGSPLDVDWDAWALFLSVNHFSGEDTGFTQIRRITFGSRLEFTATSAPTMALDFPAWLLRPEHDGDVDTLWDAIRSSARPRFREEVDLTLSGGLDSRLILAALNCRRSARITSWTTHGSAGDFEIAPLLAVGRTHAHVQVESSLEDWRANFLPTVRRLEHGTSAHTWIQPLSEAVHDGTATLYDGFAGDLFLRRRALTHTVAEDAWHAATGGRLAREDRFLSPAFRKQYAETLRATWLARGEVWSGHPSEDVLRRFTTRTNRGIALSAFRLFAPRRRVITPLIDPHVLAVAVSLAPAEEEVIDYRDLVLERYAPDLYALPTTSRADSPAYEFQDRTSAPTSLAHLIEIIGREPAAAAPLDPGLRDLMVERNYTMMRWPARLLANSAVLSDWLTLWRPRLTSTDPPWT